MEYETTINFSGDSQQVLESAIRAFSAQGLTVTSTTGSTAELQGKASMSTAGKDPLWAVSAASLSVTGSSISIRAELGGVKLFLTLVLAISIPGDVMLPCVLYFTLYRKNPALALLIMLLVLLSSVLPFFLIRWNFRRQIGQAINKVLSEAARLAEHR